MRSLHTDILIVGGGLGGVAAALAASRLGASVVLIEESDWLGGQLTTQGVPPDEHVWIESTGATRTYRRFRELVREYYRRHYPLTAEARSNPELNPGQGYVSKICHEPRVAVAVIDEMLAGHRASGRLRVLTEHQLTSAEREGDYVRSVGVRDLRSGAELEVAFTYLLDASELGDTLEIVGAENVVGAEAVSDTGELHAAEVANPLDQQSITWCLASDYIPDADFTIDRPADYDFWKSYRAPFWPGPQLGWDVVQGLGLKKRTRALFKVPRSDRVSDDLWHFRRLVYTENFAPGSFESDIVLFNWTAMNYWLKPLVGVSLEERAEALREARQLALSVFYWLQTEAPRPDGGQGYPGLRPRPDVLGTADGLAKFPYIRESRRLVPVFRVLEQHVGVEARGGLTGAEQFHDSVGVGSYRIDLHPSTAGRTFVDIASWPFQIPLGSLIPIRLRNVLAAGKSAGTTHVTNGCFRLHPVEWNIGESAGALAAYCVKSSREPHQVRADAGLLDEFQALLVDVLGVQIAWPRYDMLGDDHYQGYPVTVR